MALIPIAHDRDMTMLAQALDRVLEAAARRDRERATAPLQRALAGELRSAWRAQSRAVLAALATIASEFAQQTDERAVRTPAARLVEAEPPASWDRLADAALATTTARMVGSMRHYVQLALDTGAGQVAAQMGISGTFTLDNPAAVGYADDYAATRVTQINDGTRQGIRRLVSEATADGWSYQRLAGAIRETYAGFTEPKPQHHIRDRAELVAVTEVGNAYEAGTSGAIRQMESAGLTMEKAWLTVGDDLVSDACADNEAAGWIPATATFPSGDDRPLAHPACRCTLQYRRAPG
ncbi:MAG: phage minor head protein [Thermomicrobiales bacterium]